MAVTLLTVGISVVPPEILGITPSIEYMTAEVFPALNTTLGDDNATTTEPEGEIICTKEYTPVCAEDNRTYPNRCIAEEFYGISVLYEGECAEKLPAKQTTTSAVTKTKSIAKASAQSFIPPPLLLPPPPPAPVQPLSKPDLTLGEISTFNSLLLEDNPISFSVIIANNTGAHSATNTLSFLIDIGSNGSYDVTLAPRTIEPLIPDETRSEIWKNGLITIAGKHTARVCLDTTSPIDVFNEVNYCTFLVFTVVAQDSDVTVQSITIFPTNPVAGETVSVTGVIKNQGKGKAGYATTRLTLDMQNNGSWDIVDKNLPADVTASGAVLTQEWKSLWRTTPGFFRIELCADSENVLTESNEKNNCRIEIFNVTPDTYTGAPAVTFTIENSVLSPPSLSVMPGGAIKFTNYDDILYPMTGGIGSFQIESHTQHEVQAPLYKGTYTFNTLYGTPLLGTVIVE